MISKQITYRELKNAISISFTNDDKIFDFFDPNVEVETLEDIVGNVLEKIKTYENAIYYGIYENQEIIGYFVYKESQLISFALSMEYRIRKYLREFFKIIRKTIGKHFMCLLWNKNIRAVKFLLKHDMEIINQNDSITQLAI